MNDMSVTAEVLKGTDWLNAVQRENMADMVVTAEALKFATDWLNAVQPRNINAMVVTAEVSKLATLWLNAVQS